MPTGYALLLHDHDPEPWRWHRAVHEVWTDPETGFTHWCETPFAYVANGDAGGREMLVQEIRRVLAAAEGPELRTTALMAEGGRPYRNDGSGLREPPGPLRLAAE